MPVRVTYEPPPQATVERCNAAYRALPADLKRRLQSWLAGFVREGRAVLEAHSVAIKQHCEARCNIAVNHAEFRGAMLAAGYNPVRIRGPLWFFMIDVPCNATGFVELDTRIQLTSPYLESEMLDLQNSAQYQRRHRKELDAKATDTTRNQRSKSKVLVADTAPRRRAKACNPATHRI